MAAMRKRMMGCSARWIRPNRALLRWGDTWIQTDRQGIKDALTALSRLVRGEPLSSECAALAGPYRTTQGDTLILKPDPEKSDHGFPPLSSLKLHRSMSRYRRQQTCVYLFVVASYD